ncbi:MAG: glycosyltransferase family 39 protein [Candidatus Omnitrophica bacterium]|jgi:4-amino-4-deoxy-L-arabinose transferase-like glycosyltransferase|nr:glycosyltransferase family 39 protein [Candidatus Omnitrophota bacterium]
MIKTILKRNVLICVGIVLLWVVLFIPNNGTTRQLVKEEGRHALRAKDILENGKWLLPRVSGERYVNKPPLFPWLIVASSYITGELNEISIRLPGLLATLITGLLVFFLARKYLSDSASFFAVFFLFTLPIVLRSATLGETDILIMCNSFAVFYYWWQKYSTKKLKIKHWIVTGLLLSISTLIKGPCTQLFFYATVFCYIIVYDSIGKHFKGLLICLVISFIPLIIWASLIYKTGDIKIWVVQILRLGDYSNFNNYIKKHVYYIIKIIIHYSFWIIIVSIFWREKIFLKILNIFKVSDFYRFCFLYIICGSIVIFFLPFPRPRYISPIAPILALIMGFVYQERAKNKKNIKFIWTIVGIVILLRLIYLLAVVPYVSKKSLDKRYYAHTISALAEGHPIFKLSPEGLYNMLFYIDNKVITMSLRDFMKTDGVFVLIECRQMPKVISKSKKFFKWDLIYGPFKYSDKMLIFMKAEKLF